MAGQSIARKLAAYITELNYGDLPEEVVEFTKGRIMDSLASCYGGFYLPWSRAALESVRQNKGSSKIIANQEKVNAMDAAFVNGVMAHSINMEDTVVGGHPSSVVTPVVLALAEQESISGQEAITAIVLGYDMMYRTSLAGSWALRKGFLGGIIFGVFGSVAAAGRLMKLNEDQFTNAICYAANLASSLSQTWWEGTNESAFQAGLLARNGMVAATLGKVGATAAEDTMEGVDGFYQAYFGLTEDLDIVTQDLGKGFAVLETIEKQYPASAACQWPIRTGLSLAKRINNPRNIVKVVETVNSGCITYPGSSVMPPYKNMFQAQMSIEFCTAAALLDKPVKEVSFYEKSYNDPELYGLAAKVQLIGEEGRAYPRVEVIMKDGRSHVLEQKRVPGRPYPAPDESFPALGFFPTLESSKQKLLGMASDYLGDKGTKEVIEHIMVLDKKENIRDLVAKL